jgi:predicted O-methyltransferase YrrM
MDNANREARIRQVRAVIERLTREGVVVTRKDGETHTIFPVAVTPANGEIVRRRVMREGAAHTIEIGLGYGMSALHICEGLLAAGHANARHVVIDPFQSGRFADCGLQTLEAAGVLHLVEHHADKSHFVLPELLRAGRQFDIGFVDGNHRFDAVFLDLYYLGILVKRGGVIVLDDYDLPGIRRAVAFYVTNLNWTIEDETADCVALRTAHAPDTRHFTYFVPF